jgi:hypothetical protein
MKSRLLKIYEIKNQVDVILKRERDEVDVILKTKKLKDIKNNR